MVHIYMSSEAALIAAWGIDSRNYNLNGARWDAREVAQGGVSNVAQRQQKEELLSSISTIRNTGDLLCEMTWISIQKFTVNELYRMRGNMYLPNGVAPPPPPEAFPYITLDFNTSTSYYPAPLPDDRTIGYLRHLNTFDPALGAFVVEGTPRLYQAPNPISGEDEEAPGVPSDAAGSGRADGGESAASSYSQYQQPLNLVSGSSTVAAQSSSPPGAEGKGRRTYMQNPRLEPRYGGGGRGGGRRPVQYGGECTREVTFLEADTAAEWQGKYDNLIERAQTGADGKYALIVVNSDKQSATGYIFDKLGFVDDPRIPLILNGNIPAPLTCARNSGTTSWRIGPHPDDGIAPPDELNNLVVSSFSRWRPRIDVGYGDEVIRTLPRQLADVQQHRAGRNDGHDVAIVIYKPAIPMTYSKPAVFGPEFLEDRFAFEIAMSCYTKYWDYYIQGYSRDPANFWTRTQVNDEQYSKLDSYKQYNGDPYGFMHGEGYAVILKKQGDPRSAAQPDTREAMEARKANVNSRTTELIENMDYGFLHFSDLSSVMNQPVYRGHVDIPLGWDGGDPTPENAQARRLFSLIGRSIQCISYLSTTAEIAVARIFTRPGQDHGVPEDVFMDHGSVSFLYMCFLDSGIPFVDMKPYTSYELESEILLYKNCIITELSVDDPTVQNYKRKNEVSWSFFHNTTQQPIIPIIPKYVRISLHRRTLHTNSRNE